MTRVLHCTVPCTQAVCNSVVMAHVRVCSLMVLLMVLQLMSAWCAGRKEDWFCTHIGWRPLTTASALAFLLHFLVSTCVPPPPLHVRVCVWMEGGKEGSSERALVCNLQVTDTCLGAVPRGRNSCTRLSLIHGMYET